MLLITGNSNKNDAKNYVDDISNDDASNEYIVNRLW